jgi:uncharacterized protein YcbK (DUF882 family)
MTATPVNARRRWLLKGIACAPLAAASGRSIAQPPRILTLHHLHTDERLAVPYFADGDYLPEAIAQIERLLRDFRTNETHAIDTDLIDTLYALALTCGGGTFEIISGYRSPATNAELQATTEGVASNSFHVKGQAVDVRMHALETAILREAALNLARGGVGYYPKSNFIHLDTGRARSW